MLVKMKNMFIIDEGIIQTIIDMFSTIFSNKYEHIMLCSNTSFPNQCVLQYWQLGYRMLRFERPRPCGPGCFADAWVGAWVTQQLFLVLGWAHRLTPSLCILQMGGWIYNRLTLCHGNENNNFGRITGSLHQTNSII